MNKIEHLIMFEFSPTVHGQDNQEWLQITSISGMGDVNKEIKQKIIRLSEADQKELYAKLKDKFESVE